jgi:hypothetical protein
MNRDEEILEKVSALGIDVRKMLREQHELLRVQLEMEMRLHAFEARQMDMLLKQDELMRMMQVMDGRLLLREEKPKEWLDAYEVKDLLQISDATLRRRRKDGTFQARKIGKKWFYLRFSLQ